MAYDIRDSASLETLRDYVQGVIAGLEAHDGLGAFAEPWRALDAKIRAARDDRDEARFARVRAGKRYHVQNADLLSTLGALSGHAFLLAGKDAERPPYSTLFGRSTAHALRNLGFNNLRDAVETLLTAAADVSPELASQLDAVRAASSRFVAAGEARKAARLGLLTHENKRAALILETEDLGDATEAKILGAAPGRNDLVRAILSVASDGEDKKEDAEPTPAP